ncbi:hypothetical protein JCM8547_000225 [Rhodosporidiobolus lusitaniae]
MTDISASLLREPLSLPVALSDLDSLSASQLLIAANRSDLGTLTSQREYHMFLRRRREYSSGTMSTRAKEGGIFSSSSSLTPTCTAIYSLDPDDLLSPFNLRPIGLLLFRFSKQASTDDDADKAPRSSSSKLSAINRKKRTRGGEEARGLEFSKGKGGKVEYSIPAQNVQAVKHIVGPINDKGHSHKTLILTVSDFGTALQELGEVALKLDLGNVPSWEPGYVDFLNVVSHHGTALPPFSNFELRLLSYQVDPSKLPPTTFPSISVPAGVSYENDDKHTLEFLFGKRFSTADARIVLLTSAYPGLKELAKTTAKIARAGSAVSVAYASTTKRLAREDPCRDSPLALLRYLMISEKARIQYFSNDATTLISQSKFDDLILGSEVNQGFSKLLSTRVEHEKKVFSGGSNSNGSGSTSG